VSAGWLDASQDLTSIAWLNLPVTFLWFEFKLEVAHTLVSFLIGITSLLDTVSTIHMFLAAGFTLRKD
jgi:hypothetical protein